MTTSFLHMRGWLPASAFAPGVVGGVAALGAVAVGMAIVEAALIPGLLIGGAAVLAPRLLPGRRRQTAPPSAPVPTAHSAEIPASGEPAPFGTWRALVKTFTYRVMVTTADFGANYFVIGELTTAASLSSLSLVAGPIAYFAHEAAWHYYGPRSAQHPDPLEASVDVPIPGAAEENGRLASVKVSRALAKTVTYEGVTAVSEFSANYLFVRDFAAAAGLTAFSVVIAPLVYYVHEKAWDCYDATKPRSPAVPASKLLPA